MHTCCANMRRSQHPRWICHFRIQIMQHISWNTTSLLQLQGGQGKSKVLWQCPTTKVQRPPGVPAQVYPISLHFLFHSKQEISTQ